MVQTANPGKGGVTGISFEQFAAAIVSQESGGNYSARSPAGALGKYQILGSNVPQWSREALGYSITPSQFLASPSLQDRIALFKLRQYYNSYGPAGAASAWYSGNPNRVNDRSPVAGGPSVYDYVRSVLRKASGKGFGDIASNVGGAVGGAVSGAAGAVGGLAGDILGGAAKQIAKPIKELAFQSLFALGGIGLIVLGVQQSVTPTVRRAIGV